jgi:hypothetical protein
MPSCGQAGVMGMEFDPDNNALWAWCDNTCGNKATLLGITTTSNGRFVLRAGYNRPSGMGDFNKRRHCLRARLRVLRRPAQLLLERRQRQ